MIYAFDLMEFDSRVKVIFVNVFGGALDMHRLVEAIINTVKFEVISKPMVLRLRGNFEEDALPILRNFL